MKVLKSVPKFGDKSNDVKLLQMALLDHGFDPGPIDGNFGQLTRAGLSAFQKSKGMVGSGVIPVGGGRTFKELGLTLEKKSEEPLSPVKAPPWYVFAKKFKGKRETDPEFAKMMVPKWKLVGLNLGTIAKNWAAWCGLAMAVALAGAGLSYQKDGAAAKNWAKYGVEIDWRKDGIPRGAILHINGSGNCKSAKSNHVTQADGDCTAQDLLKKGATINGYGGNQGNEWKTSTYSVGKLCAVRWPKEYPMRGRILKSVNCTSGKAGSESTR